MTESSKSEEIITHEVDGQSRCWKKCQCQICGIVAVCTPTFDFYTSKLNKSLQCETCMRKEVNEILKNV